MLYFKQLFFGVQEINKLLKQFEEMRKMMRMMNRVQDGKMKLPNFPKR